MTKQIFALIATVFLLSACGEGFQNSGLIDLSSGLPIGKYQGSWYYNAVCTPVAITTDNPAQSVSWVLTFSGQNVTTSITLFSDTGCAVPIIRSLIVGTYSVGAVRDDVGGNELTLKFTPSVITPLTTNAATYMNGASVCGDSSGWSAGVGRSVQPGQSCLLVPGVTIIGLVTETTYDLIKVDESVSPRRLYLGSYSEGYDGATPEKRPIRYVAVGFVKL